MRASRAFVSRTLRSSASLVETPGRVVGYFKYVHERAWAEWTQEEYARTRNAGYERARRYITYGGTTAGLLVGLNWGASMCEAYSHSFDCTVSGIGTALVCGAAGAASGRYAHYALPLAVGFTVLAVAHRVMRAHHDRKREARDMQQYVCLSEGAQKRQTYAQWKHEKYDRSAMYDHY